MKILFIVNTQFELYYLSSVAYLLKKKDKNLKIKLLIRLAIKDKITPEIESIYSEIFAFEFPENFPKREKKSAKLMFSFLYNIYQSIKFRAYLKKFNFDADIICISSFREHFANVLCKQVPRHIRLIALRMADSTDELISQRTKSIKNSMKALYLNIKNFFFGYSLMNYGWNKETGQIASINFIKYPYHRTISTTDHDLGRINNNYRLFPPFVALKELYGEVQENERLAILVAGERTSLYETWDKDSKKYNEFLDYLKNNFKGYDLYFKGRGKLTEIKKLNLDGFKIISGNIPIEELCLKKRFEKVISIKSTCSKIGASFGYDSYLLYPMFNLPKNSRQVVESYFQDIRSIVKVKTMSDLVILPEKFLIKKEDLVNQYYQAIVK